MGSRRIPKYNTVPTLIVPVRGIPWKIKFLTEKQIDKVVAEALGYADSAIQTIYVDYTRSRITTINTLFHELFHAWVSSLMGCKESEDAAVNEESAANAVGDGVLELLPHMERILAMVDRLCGKETPDVS